MILSIVLLQVLFLISSVASVNISLTSGELCEGAVTTWTCVAVDGVIIGWRNLGETEFPSYVSSNLVPLGPGSPFNTTLTSIDGTIITSIARANLTSAVNESLLECTDGGFSRPPTTNVTLILKDSKYANLNQHVFFGNGIRINWSGATCAASYRLSVYLSVYEVDVKDVAGPTHDFIPETSGDYIFELTSVDYLGNVIGSTNSTSIPWREPKVSVDINVNNRVAIFTFKNDDDERPPITSCSITFDDVLKSCVMDTIVIFNTTSGAKHSYNITIFNIVGQINRSGKLSNEIKVQNITIVVAALGALIILSICWIVLRICWKRQCCCPRIWRSSFWLLFFCYDCCTYGTGEKE